MDNLHVAFLVGNGFNHFISNYYKNNPEAVKNKMIKYLKRNPEDAQSVYDITCAMLDSYKSLLHFISLEAYENQGEDLIARLNDLFDTLDDEMMDDFVNKIKLKIQDRMEYPLKDSDLKNNSICKLIARTFYYEDTTSPLMYALESELNQIFLSFAVFTTNYDGIAEQVFNPFLLSSTSPYQAHALHGNYKDKQIICHNPDKKLAAITNDAILLERFNHFKECMRQTDILIIFGNSLSSDKHILEVLNTYTYNKVIVIDANPYKYIHQYAEEPFMYKAHHRLGITTWKSKEAPNDYEITDSPEKLVQALKLALTENN